MNKDCIRPPANRLSATHKATFWPYIISCVVAAVLAVSLFGWMEASADVVQVTAVSITSGQRCTTDLDCETKFGGSY